MIEVEVKLLVRQEEAAKLAETKTVKKFSVSEKKEQLLSFYYDTNTQALKQNRYSLRVRRTSKGYIQNTKSGGSVHEGLHQREELEWVLEDEKPKLDVLPKAIKQVIRADGDEVKNLFSTDFVRHIWHLRLEDGTEVELAFDHGKLIANNLQEPICEIELELCEGSKESLLALSKKLQRELDVQPFDISKASRGYELYNKSEKKK